MSVSTPMDIDSPRPAAAVVTTASGLNGLSKHINGISSTTAKVVDVISKFRPTKLFRREVDDKHTSILSLDYDDPGELLMTSESDESIQIYNVKDGKHQKSCLSKKYGVKLAKFSRTSACIVYASTKENDAIRYLSTHDNTFIRYFQGHDKAITCLAMHPGADQFISCSEDNTVRLWDTNTSNCCGKLLLSHPYLAAFDPSANVFAVASEAAQTVLLYDFRQYDKEPFAAFDMLQHAQDVASDMQQNGQNVSPVAIAKGWNKLEFSNDGKSLLVGTKGPGHFLLDAFDGTLRAYLYREHKGSRRLAAGEHNVEPTNPNDYLFETSGECCFTPDGRYVLSGMRNENVLVWDTLKVTNVRRSRPIHTFEMKNEAAVMAFNPRYNFFTTADKELVFWIPDPHADPE